MGEQGGGDNCAQAWNKVTRTSVSAPLVFLPNALQHLSHLIQNAQVHVCVKLLELATTTALTTKHPRLM